ncbi:succinate dehydrogenase assembly factor 4 [Roseomonas rosulenta]|uniref:succinate dehydrogenase assembly factor 4 n=1 Tax=Roseomonas rosulenta TaxID=2748667 RepID=UPI0018E02E56|nr:succinate dehydrogenase assembly factor 4 [Roseomonas rosulenta]
MTQTPDNDPARAGKDPVQPAPDHPPPDRPVAKPAPPPKLPREIGGPTGPEPTRFGDWERKGRVSDF